MKVLIAILTAAVVLTTFTVLGAYARADEPISTTLAKLDPDRDGARPKDIPGAYRSPFGAQVHPMCFEYVRKQTGLSRDDAAKGFESYLEQAARAVVGCENRYPELKPYLREWIHLFRRARFVCSAKTGAQLDLGAANVPDASNMRDSFDARERDGVALESDRGRLPYPIVQLPSDTMAGLAKSGGTAWDVDTIVHEVLHSTHANNRWDHNDIEKKKAGAGGKCGHDNISLDRINVVSTLCSGQKLAGNDDTAEVLFERMSDCGAHQCERFFEESYMKTGHGSDEREFRSWDPNAGLAKKDAASLCSRIYDLGQCHYDLDKQGKVLLKGDRVLGQLGRELHARLDAIFVPGAARLAPELLDLVPDARDDILSERESECFKSVFTLSARGAVSIPQDRLPAGFGKSVEGSPATPDVRLDQTIDALDAAITHSKACKEATRGKLLVAVRQFRWKASDAFMTSTWGAMMKRRYLGDGEQMPSPAYDSAAPLAKLRKLVGAGLYDRYVAAVDARHWRSQNVDCAKLGYSPEGRLRGGFVALEKFKPQTIHCLR